MTIYKIQLTFDKLRSFSPLNILPWKSHCLCLDSNDQRDVDPLQLACYMLHMAVVLPLQMTKQSRLDSTQLFTFHSSQLSERSNSFHSTYQLDPTFQHNTYHIEYHIWDFLISCSYY